MSTSLYLDTSAVLRALLEAGAEIQERIGEAEVLITSRLTVIEGSRALDRARELGRISDLQRADAQRQLDQLWARCHVWEITRAVCDDACTVAPRTGLRTLDAIHVATFLQARRRLGPELAMLTSDDRLHAALKS
jgi:predicted nucleic acid-binding protein